MQYDADFVPCEVEIKVAFSRGSAARGLPDGGAEDAAEGDILEAGEREAEKGACEDEE